MATSTVLLVAGGVWALLFSLLTSLCLWPAHRLLHHRRNRQVWQPVDLLCHLLLRRRLAGCLPRHQLAASWLLVPVRLLLLLLLLLWLVRLPLAAESNNS
jgi:hypothetical protein